MSSISTVLRPQLKLLFLISMAYSLSASAGLYSTNFKKMQSKHRGRALEKAVKGMLPKGPLGYAMAKKMKVYAGDQHTHSAQQPQLVKI